MPQVILYFQYTYLSNVDLSSLRVVVSSWQGNMELISAKQFKNMSVSIGFGKLLMVVVRSSIFQVSMLSQLLSKFKVLHLLFIKYNSFLLSPSLYLSYFSHKLSNVPMHSLYGLSICLNNIRLLLFKIRYFQLTIDLLFQEKLLYKFNIQYIC